MRQLIFRFAFFLSLLLLPALSFAQGDGKQIQVKHANSLKGAGSGNNKYQRLIGAVEFEHAGVLMTCDSAHLFPQTNTMLAYGNVHIHQGDSINVWGDQLKYDGNTRTAELTKNVRMTDRDMNLTTDAITYDMTLKTASYFTGGKIISQNNVLTSQYGTYSTEGKSLSFKKNVVLVNPQYVMKCDTLVYLPVTKVARFYGPTTIQATNNSNLIYCENGFYDTNADICQFEKHAYILTKDQLLKGDSIWYNRKIGLGKAMKNVEIIDSAQAVTIRGDLATHDEKTDISLVTGHALYIQSFDNDSLFLHADTLKSITLHDSTAVTTEKKKKGEIENDSLKKEDGRLVLAYNNVRFFKPDFQGRCDSLAWSSEDSTMHLFNDPVLWSGESQMTAEKVDIIVSHGEIIRLELETNAFIVSEEDSTRYNQIKGKRMTGYFRKNELYQIYVDGNGQTLYYAKDQGQLIGVNRADCSRLLIAVLEQEVQAISFYDKPAAILYPPADLPPKEALLKDFQWRAGEQPLSVEDLFVK